MNEELLYTLGMLTVILGLTAIYLFPGSILITLAIMFIGILAVLSLFGGIVLLLFGRGANSMFVGVVFLVILILLFDGIPIILYGLKLVLAATAAILQLIATAIASLI